MTADFENPFLAAEAQQTDSDLRPAVGESSGGDSVGGRGVGLRRRPIVVEEGFDGLGAQARAALVERPRGAESCGSVAEALAGRRSRRWLGGRSALTMIAVVALLVVIVALAGLSARRAAQRLTTEPRDVAALQAANADLRSQLHRLSTANSVLQSQLAAVRAQAQAQQLAQYRSPAPKHGR